MPEEQKPEAEISETRQALERFVVENDDLLTLESRIGRFNIFDALGIARAEIRHSNFLAFILDPAESHGQGQLFLKPILMDLLKKAPPELRPFSPIDLDGTDLRGVEVKREWKRIDLLLTCEDPAFAVVIENKVDSHEHSDQLQHYHQTMTEHYPDLRPLYIYLTPDGEAPSEKSWLPYTYTHIHRVLQRIRKTYKNAIGDDVLVFLDHYLNLLGTRFMNDKKLDELCQRIHKNHRQALDLIWERVGSPAAGTVRELASILEDDHRLALDIRSSAVFLLPKDWLGWLPQLGLKSDREWWIYVRLNVQKGGIEYSLDVAPFTEVAKRVEVVTKLLEECPRIEFERPKSAAKQIKNNYSRLTASENILQWGEDEEPEPAAIRASVTEMLKTLYPKLEKLALVLKTLFKIPSASK
jgi:hypothetical protein